MINFKKTVYEEFYRTHEFNRSDGEGWLAIGETISTASVIVTERDTGIDKSSTMVSDAGPYGSPATQVKYKIKAGEQGKAYLAAIRVNTSNNQKFEDIMLLEVK